MGEEAKRAAHSAAVVVVLFERERQKRWDEEHMITASCRLRKEEMQELREECWKQGTTVYGLLKEMIYAYLEERRERWRKLED